MTYAKVVADSLSPGGVRLTTMEVRMHRFVLAEFNTHRVFSRNSASSRAIPVAKQIDRVISELAWPVSWPAEQKGMSGGAEVDEPSRLDAMKEWEGVSDVAIRAVDQMTNRADRTPVHKSVVNRLLEPFMWHTVVVTATAWENFFALRLDKDAQPEIRAAAEAMKAAYDASTPEAFVEGRWHLPYIDGKDYGAAAESEFAPLGKSLYPILAKVSAARCARVSYLTHDGKRDLQADLSLYDRLVTDRVEEGLPVHWSPLEHVATPWAANRQPYGSDLVFQVAGRTYGVATQHLPRVGNLLGWRSLRTEVETIHKARTYC